MSRIGGWVDRPDRLFAYQNDKKRSTVQEHVYFKPVGVVDTLTVGHVPKIIYQEGELVPKIISTKRPQDRETPNLYDICPTLQANDYKEPKLVLLEASDLMPKIIDDQGRTKKQLRLLDTCPTLRAQSHGNEPKVLLDGETDKPKALRPVRTDYGKEVRKAYESGEFWDSRHNMTQLEPRDDEISNTLTTVLKDNLLLVPNQWRNANKRKGANGMKFIDLFAGIGGFRLGMEAAGHQCVGYVEWDKYARQSYQAIHDTEGEWTAHDITTVTDDDLRLLGEQYGPIDIITGGFPCQAFSVAGKQLGFNDTRGTLFFEIARFASILKPKYLFLENVKGLLSHDEGNTFATILSALDELGYDAEWQVCNSKDFGVPQNRERVFIIGHSRKHCGREVFPVAGENGEAIKIAGRLDGTFRSTNEILDISGVSTCLNTMQGDNREPKVLVPFLQKHDGLQASAVLTPDREEKRQNGRRMKEPNEPMFTLTAQDRHGVMVQEKPEHIPGVDDINNTLRTGGKGSIDAKHNYEHIHDGYRIRKLTPRECWRLQGFPDWAFDRAQADGVSDSQLYKQAGNSVTVNVIYAIAKHIR